MQISAGLKSLLTDRRFVLIALLTLGIALYFWLGSRYPALSGKAAMGGATPISGIAFDTLIEVLPDSTLLQKITADTINWAYTNWKGMTFGLLFGACALTLLGLVPRRNFQHPFANAALGAAIGAPLGVCVNCAAPIARGLHSAGMRLETTLAALIASPTLNVIVVSMSFALLPVYMAGLKLVAMLAFILVVIPLLTHFVFRREREHADQIDYSVLETAQDRGGLWGRLEALRPAERGVRPSTWLQAGLWLIKSYGRNLLYIVILTLPLMLLAGVLGAILVSVFPFSDLLALTQLGEGQLFAVGLILLLAGVAILLPVPMSFDVILAVILINAGWPPHLVMPLLLGLGSFSVYSFLVVGRAISFRVAGTVMVALALMAVASSVPAKLFDHYGQIQARADRLRELSQARDLPTPPVYSGLVQDRGQLAPLLAATTVRYAPLDRAVVHSGPGRIDLTSSVMQAGPQRGSGPLTTRLLGGEIGLDQQPFLSGLEVIEPYTVYTAVASGDIHGDGWLDIALAQDARRGGAVLFANREGRFVRQVLDLGPLQGTFINALAFVDLNNDGRPDLFVSSYLHGAYVFWNQGGGFDPAKHLRLPNGDAAMIGAAAFADLDGDGDLDIVAANWSVGTSGLRSFLMTSRDRVLWNEGGTFTPALLDGLPGESLTSLITDVDGDGRPDILIGDDVSKADKVYLNQGDRQFRLVSKSDRIIPWLTTTTMSLDAGDIDNDLRSDLYSAQIAIPDSEISRLWRAGPAYCGDPAIDPRWRDRCIIDVNNRAAAQRRSNPSNTDCAAVTDPAIRALCSVRSVINRASASASAAGCKAIPARWRDLRATCLLVAGPRVPDAQKQSVRDGYLGGIVERNLLLQQDANGRFEDRTKALGVATPGWSWNARFVDLDQDGWQDLFVATGFLGAPGADPNAFYQNDHGRGFVETADRNGLADAIPTSSYTLLDYDRDGDMDVIRASAVTEPLVHRSDRPVGKAIWIRLVDSLGNTAGVGATIEIRSGANLRQMREIRLSGGFASSDAPRAHFGLGDADHVDEIIVHWRDGARTVITGPIAGNSELVVRRS